MKKSRWVLLGVAGVFMGLFNTGCASLVYGTTQTISITSTPPGSTAKLREVGASQATITSAGPFGNLGGQGNQLMLPQTLPSGPVIKTVAVPGEFTLDKSTSTLGYGYTLTIEKDGYKPAQVHLVQKMIGMKCILVEALGGMLLVPIFIDMANNPCMELVPSIIEVVLEKENGKKE